MLSRRLPLQRSGWPDNARDVLCTEIAPFDIAEHAPCKALAIALQQPGDALHLDDIRTDPDNHGVLSRAVSMRRFISRMASAQPMNKACATIAWPMLSSEIRRIAATGCTL